MEENSRVTSDAGINSPDDLIIFVFDVITGNVVEPVVGLLSHVRLLKKRG
jgi:hypothetical protein